MPDSGMATTEPRSKPTTEDKIIALADAVTKLTSRVDAVVAAHSSKADASKADADDGDDDDSKKDAEGEEEGGKDEPFGGKKAPPFGKKDAKADAGDEDDKDEDKDKDEDAKDDGAKKDKKDEDLENMDEKAEKPVPTAADYSASRAKDAARSDAATIRKLRSDLDALLHERRRTDDDLNALSEKQTQWNEVAMAFGAKASRPLDGESLETYDRRHAKRFQKYSPKWKDHNLDQLPGEVLTTITAPDIRADSIKAAYQGEPGAEPVLREIRKTDSTGRIISEFAGPISAMLDQFRMPVMRLRKINREFHNY